jgi:hypothetical protein
VRAAAQQLDQSVERVRSYSSLYWHQLLCKFDAMLPRCDGPPYLASELKFLGHTGDFQDRRNASDEFSDMSSLLRDRRMRLYYIRNMMPPPDEWPVEWPSEWSRSLSVLQCDRGISNIDHCLDTHRQLLDRTRSGDWIQPMVSFPKGGGHGYRWALEQKSIDERPDLHNTLNGSPGFWMRRSEEEREESIRLHMEQVRRIADFRQQWPSGTDDQGRSAMYVGMFTNELREEAEVRAYLADKLARWADAESQLKARGDYCEHNQPRWRRCTSCDDALRRQAVKLRGNAKGLQQWISERYAEIQWANSYVSPYRPGVRQQIVEYVPVEYSEPASQE